MGNKVAIDCHGNSYTYQTQISCEEYEAWVKAAKAGDDGPETYEWDEGIAP